MLDSLGRSSALVAQLAGHDAEKGVPSWARSHPLTQDRVARALRQAAGGTAKTRNRDVVLNELDGTLYDDDPTRGVVGGPGCRHPAPTVQFGATHGFHIKNDSENSTR